MPITAGLLDGVNPTIQTATSTLVLAAQKDRRFLMIQNNSGAPIAISFRGINITSLTPSASNPVFVLSNTPGINVWMSGSEVVPSGAITVYQTSGGPISSISCFQMV